MLTFMNSYFVKIWLMRILFLFQKLIEDIKCIKPLGGAKENSRVLKKKFPSNDIFKKFVF